MTIKALIVLAILTQSCHSFKITKATDFDRAYISSSTGKPTGTVPEPAPTTPSTGLSNKHSFYRDTVDYLALSQEIYEIMALRAENEDGEERSCDTAIIVDATVDRPLAERDLNDILKNNLNRIKNQDEAVDQAIECLGEYYSKDNIPLYDTRSAAPINDRQIVKFGDSKSQVEQSRVYMLSVNSETKRAEIVFRGSSNLGDWETNFKALWRRKLANPVKDIQSSIPHLYLHRGFTAALVGENEDFSGPIDEILAEIKAVMKPGYSLYVTGHSLGGALATIFAFHAAQDADIVATRPVSLFTYASPRVGGREFQSAFKFLEERGSLRHARLRNQKDRVTMVPYLNGNYAHVGLEFRLRAHSQIPVLDYPTSRDWTQKGLGFLENILSLPQIATFHTTKLLLGRIQEQESSFAGSSLRAEYQTLLTLERLNLP